MTRRDRTVALVDMHSASKPRQLGVFAQARMEMAKLQPITRDGGPRQPGTRMKAIVQRTYGAPETVLELQDLDRPVVADEEVLVRVHAASVNPGDVKIMRGRPYLVRLAGYGLRRPKNPVPGTDVAGVVETTGKGVTRLRPGDAVFGWCRGAYAEFAYAPEDHFVRKPENLSFEQAASVPLAATTALQGLRDVGRLRPGQTVLVIGASGGVGTFAIQIAKALGAEVTGVCSTRNVEMVRSIGADHVIDYTREDPMWGEQRYDLIFQLAGARSPWECRRRLTREGTLVLCSGDGRLTGIDRIVTAMVVSPFVSQRLATWVATPSNADLLALNELIESGKITPVIDSTYTLDEAPAAIHHLDEGHSRGKVVIAC
jgi:NADPH:quinone reductase-like Zn-dependent oxidoreductase